MAYKDIGKGILYITKQSRGYRKDCKSLNRDVRLTNCYQMNRMIMK